MLRLIGILPKGIVQATKADQAGPAGAQEQT
jgi:hypothetical protein